MPMGLEEKLKRLAERSVEEKVDQDHCKSEWISAVTRLYDDVEVWLKPWIDKGYLRLERNPMPKFEESLGDYEIDTLEITAGNETIVFEPFGRNVIGARGRIDVYSRGFRFDGRLLLRFGIVEGEQRWELWQSKTSGPRFPFDKDRLEKLLDEWL